MRRKRKIVKRIVKDRYIMDNQNIIENNGRLFISFLDVDVSDNYSVLRHYNEDINEEYIGNLIEKGWESRIKSSEEIEMVELTKEGQSLMNSDQGQ